MAENLLEINDFSTATRDKIVEILDIILYKFEMLLATDKNIEKRKYIETPFNEKRYEHISLGDVKRTTEILDKNLGSLGFRFSISGIDRIKLKSSWEGIYQEIKDFRDTVQVKKSAITSDEIVDLIIVKPKNDSNSYLVIVNQRFNQPIEADRAKPSWNLLFEIVKNRELAFFGEYKASLDYLNSNSRCKLYTQTGLSITKILYRDGGMVKPAVKIKMITDKAYKQKVNSQQKST